MAEHHPRPRGGGGPGAADAGFGAVYSKVPGNRFAYRGDFAAIDSLLGTEITFDMVQRILLGQGIGLLDEDSKYISKVDGREHLLISKYKRRVKRLVGVKGGKLPRTTASGWKPPKPCRSGS